VLDVTLAGRYRLESQIGSGGIAAVWHATDGVLERSVSVKIVHRHLLSNGVFCDRFREEAVRAGALIHPNVVAVYDTGNHDEAPYVVMEYLGGGSLAEILDREGPLSPGRVAAIGAEVCDALAYAHRSGVVHRDLRPANILFSDAGQLKVTDFAIGGVALGGDLAATGALLGTLSFMAPEVLEGAEGGPAADLYALGVVLFRALTGRTPRKPGSSVATSGGRGSHAAHPRDLRPDVPRDLDVAVARALSASPEDRFDDAAELGRILRSVAQAKASRTPVPVARPASPPAPPSSPSPSASPSPSPDAPPAGQGGLPSFVRTEGRWLAPVALLVLVAIAVVVGVLQLSGHVSIIGGGGSPAASPKAADVPATLGPGSIFKPGDEGSGEHNAQVPLAFDGDPTTSWQTQGYFSADFGGLRPRSGEGIYGDAGQAVALKRIEVDTSLPGWTAAIESSDDAQTWSAPSATATVTTQQSFDVSKMGSHRYWMVWITNLVTGNGGYQASISEIKAFK